MAAGALAVIFINDDGDMVAPRLEPERDPEMHAWLAEMPTICLTKPDGDRLRCENAFSCAVFSFESDHLPRQAASGQTKEN